MNIEEYENIKSIHRVPVAKLRSEFDANQFSFQTTHELEKRPKEMIGQSRAEQAMDFGLAVEQTGYNLFVVGPSGTGRITYTQDSVARMAKDRTVPDDQCYVCNFDNPDRPYVISLPAGSGIQFQRKIETLLIDIQREMQSTFSGEVYEKGKRIILEKYRAQVEQIWKEAEAFAVELNFKIERTPTGINTYPLLFGKPMERTAYENLSAENKELIKAKEKQIEGKVQETVYQMGKINEELRKAMEQFMRETSAKAIEGLFLPLKEAYQENEKVLAYLEAYLYDAVEHFSVFLPEDDAESDENIMRSLIGSKEQQLHRYTVNLFVNIELLATYRSYELIEVGDSCEHRGIPQLS